MVPRSQDTATPYDHTVGLRPGPSGVPGGEGGRFLMTRYPYIPVSDLWPFIDQTPHTGRVLYCVPCFKDRSLTRLEGLETQEPYTDRNHDSTVQELETFVPEVRVGGLVGSSQRRAVAVVKGEGAGW